MKLSPYVMMAVKILAVCRPLWLQIVKQQAWWVGNPVRAAAGGNKRQHYAISPWQAPLSQSPPRPVLQSYKYNQQAATE